MSYYQRREVLIRPNGNDQVAETVKKLIPMLSESGAGEFELRQNGEDAFEFGFEYYSAEAYELFEQLLSMIEGSERSGAIVSCDSDYGSYIESYGNVSKLKIEPGDIEWRTGDVPSTRAVIPEKVFCDMVKCDPEDLERFIDEDQDPAEWDPAAGMITETVCCAVPELLNIYCDEGNVILEYGWTDKEDSPGAFLTGGTAEKLSRDLKVLKELAAAFEAKGGKAVSGLGELPEEISDLTVKNTWISESGYRELELDIVNGTFGEFEAYEYAIRG